MSETIGIDRTTLQIVFDVATNSMDFSSGFLDEEEVQGLRDVAAILGVDPMVAAPENRKCKYLAKHDPWGSAYPQHARRCKRCKAIVPECDEESRP